MCLKLIITSLVMGSYVDVATCVLIPYANARPFSSMPTSIETWWHLQVKEMTEQHKATAQEKEQAKRSNPISCRMCQKDPFCLLGTYKLFFHCVHYQNDTEIRYYMLKDAL